MYGCCSQWKRNQLWRVLWKGVPLRACVFWYRSAFRRVLGKGIFTKFMCHDFMVLLINVDLVILMMLSRGIEMLWMSAKRNVLKRMKLRPSINLKNLKNAFNWNCKAIELNKIMKLSTKFQLCTHIEISSQSKLGLLIPSNHHSILMKLKGRSNFGKVHIKPGSSALVLSFGSIKIRYI